jgi:hypothetical protein
VAYGVAAEYGRPVMLHPSRGANMPDYLTETESHTRESKHPDSVRSEDDYPESFRDTGRPSAKRTQRLPISGPIFSRKERRLDRTTLS